MKLTKTQLLKIIEEEIVNERCQKGYKTHPTRKTKVMFGRKYRNCVKAESVELDEATQGEMAMEELNKTIHAGLLDRGKDNDRYDALIKAADVVEDELARVLKDIYPGSGKPSLNIQPISYRILQFDVFTPDHVEFNIEAIPSRGGDATIYNLKVEFPFGDDQLEDEKYDAIKKLRGGHGNIKSIKGILNLIKQGGSLYKSQTGSLAAEPEAQAQLPFGESKMKKITKSKLNAIIKEEIQNVVGSLQEDVEKYRRNNKEYVYAVALITDAILAGKLGEPSDEGEIKRINKVFKGYQESGQIPMFKGGHDRAAVSFIHKLTKAAPEAMKKLGLKVGSRGAGVIVAAKNFKQSQAAKPAAPAAPEKKKGFFGKMLGR